MRIWGGYRAALIHFVDSSSTLIPNARSCSLARGMSIFSFSQQPLVCVANGLHSQPGMRVLLEPHWSILSTAVRDRARCLRTEPIASRFQALLQNRHELTILSRTLEYFPWDRETMRHSMLCICCLWLVNNTSCTDAHSGMFNKSNLRVQLTMQIPAHGYWRTAWQRRCGAKSPNSFFAHAWWWLHYAFKAYASPAQKQVINCSFSIWIDEFCFSPPNKLAGSENIVQSNFRYAFDNVPHIKSRHVIRLNLSCNSDQSLLQFILGWGVNHLLLHLRIVVTPVNSIRLFPTLWIKSWNITSWRTRSCSAAPQF